jgi:hypothetical protein
VTETCVQQFYNHQTTIEKKRAGGPTLLAACPHAMRRINSAV